MAMARPFEHAELNRRHASGLEEDRMKTATNRLRGVERDIVQMPQPGDKAPYYEPQGNEVAVFEAAYRKAAAGDAEGPNRLRQDALSRVHGVPVEAPARHRVVPRGPDQLGPGRTLPAGRRGNRVAGRAAHPRGEGGRDLLPRRDRGGAHRLDGRDPLAHRPPAPAHDREEGPGDRGARGLHAGDLLQPRLPDGAEGSQALHQAALHRAQLRFSRRGDSSARSSSTRRRASRRSWCTSWSPPGARRGC